MAQQVNPVYQSFLLRCWLPAPVTGSDLAVWRFVLREVSAEYPEQGFSDLEKLKEYVALQLDGLARSNGREGDDGLNSKRGRL